MILYPAIDLRQGRCVRLRQGRMEDETIFSDDPVQIAGRWVNAGARRLHLVDLNGAFAGRRQSAFAPRLGRMRALARGFGVTLARFRARFKPRRAEARLEKVLDVVAAAEHETIAVAVLDFGDSRGGDP